MRFIKLEDKFNQRIKTILFIYIYIFKTFGRIKLIKKRFVLCIVASKKKKRKKEIIHTMKILYLFEMILNFFFFLIMKAIPFVKRTARKTKLLFRYIQPHINGRADLVGSR